MDKSIYILFNNNMYKCIICGNSVESELLAKQHLNICIDGLHKMNKKNEKEYILKCWKLNVDNICIKFELDIIKQIITSNAIENLKDTANIKAFFSELLFFMKNKKIIKENFYKLLIGEEVNIIVDDELDEKEGMAYLLNGVNTSVNNIKKFMSNLLKIEINFDLFKKN
mgnify:CR=1 FL=1